MNMKNNTPTMVLTGGGTGGHITPILAVAHEIKQQNPSVKLVYIGERGGHYTELTDNHDAIDTSRAIFAGKLRRYHGESWLKRILDVHTNVLNIRDAIRLLIGIVQSYVLLGRIKPQVVFLKGGFVGVPVGLAAAMRRIPIVTHDSDALPGLANRMVSRWVSVHATALAPEYYTYPSGKVQAVGVLVEHTYQPVTPKLQRQCKLDIGISTDNQVLLITGGSSGAERLNKAVASFVDELLNTFPKLTVIHQVGKGKLGVYGSMKHPRLHVVEFMNPMYKYTSAADVIVTRAGANALAEFGIQKKACIVVPNGFLTGGHQLKNAQILKDKDAAIIVEEGSMYDLQQGLFPTVVSLLKDSKRQETLSSNLATMTIPGAAKKLATVLLAQIDT